jgi:DNA-binding transcriptional regulator YiaG
MASGCSKSTESASSGSGEPASSGSAAAASEKVAAKPADPTEEPVRELSPEEISALRSVVGLTPPEPLAVSELLTRADIREMT